MVVVVVAIESSSDCCSHTYNVFFLLVTCMVSTCFTRSNRRSLRSKSSSSGNRQ